MEDHVLGGKLVKKARDEGRHIGFYLFKRPSPFWAGLYIVMNILLPLGASLFIAFQLDSPAAAILLYLPVWQLLKSFADLILLHTVTPRPLPRLDMTEGIPAEDKSLCVISTILGGNEAERLEELRLCCRSEGENLLFGLLADLPAAKTPEAEYDGELLRAARRTVRQLNRKYGGGFYLFTRPRRFDGEGYSGHERKRGALLALAKLLRGQETELEVTGDREALAGVKYLITLDCDTRVYPGAMGQLIGAAAHPLNTPVIDPKKKRVVKGYGLLHPRMSTEQRRPAARRRGPAGGGADSQP